MKGLHQRPVVKGKGLGWISTSGTPRHHCCQSVVPGVPCLVPLQHCRAHLQGTQPFQL